MDKKLLSNSEIPVVLKLLDEQYPDAGCALHYDTRFHLLCAVMLSAQTTDARVNLVTPELFKQYPDAKTMAKGDAETIGSIIRSIGLYRNKAANLIRMSRELTEQYGGEVPGEYDQLIRLPGVGRKTANVVLAEGFGVQRIAVDTHVFRVSNRIGLACSDDVLETEEQLMQRIDSKCWTKAHHLLIFHGRNCCRARKPDCAACPVRNYCVYLENMDSM